MGDLMSKNADTILELIKSAKHLPGAIIVDLSHLQRAGIGCANVCGEWPGSITMVACGSHAHS
jgi:hypothetical protein